MFDGSIFFSLRNEAEMQRLAVLGWVPSKGDGLRLTPIDRTLHRESGLNTGSLNAAWGCAGDVAVPRATLIGNPCSSRPLHSSFHRSLHLHIVVRDSIFVCLSFSVTLRGCAGSTFMLIISGVQSVFARGDEHAGTGYSLPFGWKNLQTSRWSARIF